MGGRGRRWGRFGNRDGGGNGRKGGQESDFLVMAVSTLLLCVSLQLSWVT